MSPARAVVASGTRRSHSISAKLTFIEGFRARGWLRSFEGIGA